jgi:hypothetical protein
LFSFQKKACVVEATISHTIRAGGYFSSSSGSGSNPDVNKQTQNF